MDKMREEFEAWFWNEFHKDSDVELYWSSVFVTTVNGYYRGMACHAYWTVWKASRAALCVNLPTNEITWPDGTELVDRKQVETLMDAAGVSYS